MPPAPGWLLNPYSDRTGFGANIGFGGEDGGQSIGFSANQMGGYGVSYGKSGAQVSYDYDHSGAHNYGVSAQFTQAVSGGVSYNTHSGMGASVGLSGNGVSSTLQMSKTGVSASASYTMKHVDAPEPTEKPAEPTPADGNESSKGFNLWNVMTGWAGRVGGIFTDAGESVGNLLGESGKFETDAQKVQRVHRETLTSVATESSRLAEAGKDVAHRFHHLAASSSRCRSMCL